MLKTRIKVVTDGTGYTLYYPQYKRLFWWSNWSNGPGSGDFHTNQIEQAQRVINEENKTISYIEYP